MVQEKYDIIIAGGGLSGLLTAMSLTEQCRANGAPLINIAIIESQPITHEPSHGFDARVLALSHGTVGYLSSINLWSVVADYAQPIQRIHISDRGYYGKARIDAEQHSVDALGYVIEMTLLGRALYQSLSKMDNISWYCPDSIENIEWSQQQVTVKLSGDIKLNAALLLGCDGAQSVCRQFANIAVTQKDYGQSAIICNVQMEKSHQNIAYERFTQFGPLAMLPMVDKQTAGKTCSLVWTLTPEQAKFHFAQSEDDFKRDLLRAFGSWLGEVKSVSKRLKFPLSLVQADDQVFHRMALVGNASHTIHPIAGQGFNLGARDVISLSRRIVDRWKTGEDIGSFAMLNNYAERRKQDHQTVIRLTDSLVTLFSNNLPALVAGRNIGVKALNYLSPLKSAFVNKTMGY